MILEDTSNCWEGSFCLLQQQESTDDLALPTAIFCKHNVQMEAQLELVSGINAQQFWVSCKCLHSFIRKMSSQGILIHPGFKGEYNICGINYCNSCEIILPCLSDGCDCHWKISQLMLDHHLRPAMQAQQGSPSERSWVREQWINASAVNSTDCGNTANVRNASSITSSQTPYVHPCCGI